MTNGEKKIFNIKHQIRKVSITVHIPIIFLENNLEFVHFSLLESKLYFKYG